MAGRDEYGNLISADPALGENNLEKVSEEKVLHACFHALS